VTRTRGLCALAVLLAACGPSGSDSDECVDRDLDGICRTEDCNDYDPTLSPEAAEIWYDGIDQDCDGNDNDQDWDGYPAGQDCDDTDAFVNPDAVEVWYDGIDQDCDGYDDDQDQDGHGLATDCDDLDETVSPSAAEVWYDGVDQNCDGNDDDQDGDGTPLADDCDDTDAERGPDAVEIWYDGVDQDCDGNDIDQDLDGFDYRSDCDDTDPDVNPDAYEVWYDGVDSDCGGDDDYDQDRDGFASADHAGDDCADDDPTINPDAVEVLGDGTDRDCDGDSDTSPFSALTIASTGLQGPRLTESSDGILLGLLADATASGSPGATWWFYDETEPWSAFIDASGWTLPGYVLGTGYDLVADGDMVMEAAVIADLPVRYVLALGTDLSTGAYGSTSIGGGIPDPDDLNAVYDGSTLGVVMCNEAEDFVLYLFGSMQDLFDGAGVYAYTEDGGGGTCSARVGSDKVLVSDQDDALSYGYRYGTESGTLAAIESGTDAWYDMDHTYVDGDWAFAASAGSTLEVSRGTTDASVALGGSLRKVQVALYDQTVLAVGVDTASEAWLVYGTPKSGAFTEVPLDPGFTNPVIDVDVLATSADTLMVALRSVSELAVMGVSLK